MTHQLIYETPFSSLRFNKIILIFKKFGIKQKNKVQSLKIEKSKNNIKEEKWPVKKLVPNKKI